MNLDPYFLHLFLDLSEVRYTRFAYVALEIYELRENRVRESSTFAYTLKLYLAYTVQSYNILNLVNAFVKKCVFCHEVRHLQFFLKKLCNISAIKLLLTVAHISNVL